jgi:hypothetical protein
MLWNIPSPIRMPDIAFNPGWPGIVLRRPRLPDYIQ